MSLGEASVWTVLRSCHVLSRNRYFIGATASRFPFDLTRLGDPALTVTYLLLSLHDIRASFLLFTSRNCSFQSRRTYVAIIIKRPYAKLSHISFRQLAGLGHVSSACEYIKAALQPFFIATTSHY
jgi:hypothetical protein